MKIHIRDFYSLRNVEFELSKGISVLVGKNGSGKSQVLAAIIAVCTNGLKGLRQGDYQHGRGERIEVSPVPDKILWRPAVRKIGEDTRTQDLIALQDTSGLVDLSTNAGYVFDLDARYTRLHHRLCNMFIAGTIGNPKRKDADVWRTLSESFERVFAKSIGGEYDSRGRGAKVGLIISDSEVSRFGQLSSGELEYISLLCDLLTEPEVSVILVDEIDVHFHPDLQAKVLGEIKELCKDRIVFVTAQSPAAMLGADPSKLFYLRHYKEVEAGKNQMTEVSSDYELIDTLSEMYSGFGSDVRLVKHFEVIANRELLQYAKECGLDSDVKRPNVKESDPQVSSLRSMLLALDEGSTIVEHGVGKGRLLTAFRSLDESRVATMEYIGIDLDSKNESDVMEAHDKLQRRFRAFRFQTTPEVERAADLTILANVLHEVGPDRLAGFLSVVLRQAKKGSSVLILEALELAVGEKHFVVLDGSSLQALCSRCVQSGVLSLSWAQPTSYSGVPLLEAQIKVIDPEKALIMPTDVKRMLDCVIEGGARELAMTIRAGVPANPRSLAFRCHNIANAAAFCQLLSIKDDGTFQQ